MVESDCLKWKNDVYYESNRHGVNVYNFASFGHIFDFSDAGMESSPMFDSGVIRHSEVLPDFTPNLFRIRNIGRENIPNKSYTDYYVVFGRKRTKETYIELLKKASMYVPSNLTGIQFPDWMYNNSVSRGSKAYAMIMAALLNDSPSGSGLLVMENPESGIHPDLLPTIADGIIEASKRRQIILTTHSDIMLDCFSDHASSVTVFERPGSKTFTSKIEPSSEYSLGEFWTRGGFGGNHF